MSDRTNGERNVEGPSDEELMQAYVLGNYSAFEDLYKRHSRTVYGFLSKKLKNKERVEDVFQGTFLQLHRSRAKYDSALPFLPWLFTLCRNALMDDIRAQRRVQEEPNENIADLPESIRQMEFDQVGSHQPILNIDEWGHALSPKEREVLSLRFAEDFSFDEIGRRLRIKSSGARKLSERALKKLRSIWK